MCLSVYVDKSRGSVHEWAKACPPTGESGAGGPGFPSRATADDAVQPGTSGNTDSLRLKFGSGAQGQRDMAREVLATETVYWKKAHPRLKITGGSRESTLPLPCAIISL